MVVDEAGEGQKVLCASARLLRMEIVVGSDVPDDLRVRDPLRCLGRRGRVRGDGVDSSHENGGDLDPGVEVARIVLPERVEDAAVVLSRQVRADGAIG